MAKRRRYSRKTNKNKIKKSKKTINSRKTRKNRKRRQYGGELTTSLDTPITEKITDYNNFIRLNLEKDI